MPELSYSCHKPMQLLQSAAATQSTTPSKASAIPADVPCFSSLLPGCHLCQCTNMLSFEHCECLGELLALPPSSPPAEACCICPAAFLHFHMFLFLHSTLSPVLLFF